MDKSHLIGIILIVVGLTDLAISKLVVAPKITSPTARTIVTAVMLLIALVLIGLGGALLSGRIELYL